MSQHPHYPALWEGPIADTDGEQTWFCAGRYVPIGATRRPRFEGPWYGPTTPSEAMSDDIYQVKDIPLPDPTGWKQDDGSIVTLVKHVRERTDLLSWEWRCAPLIPGDEGWQDLNLRVRDGGWSDDFAVHIRRKS